jgi:ATP-dependent DNA helicase DinG
MKIEDRFSPETLEYIRSAIREADGGEITFACHVDDQLRITEAIAVAHGSLESVAAPSKHLSRADVVVHNHPSGILMPSNADTAVASELADSSVGSYIVNNDVNDIRVLCEPFPPQEAVPLDETELAALIDRDGPLEQLIDAYEPRESQVSMVREVAQAFNNGEILAVEAGTGVGKSYAYLVPALVWAAHNEERVVISTATINLQQQLVEKDIPTVKRLTGLDLPVVLVKGRGNYLCLKRLGETLEEDRLFEDEADAELEGMRQWSETTATGSRSELPHYCPDELWSRVNSDADSCTELRCRLRERCFFLKARREAAAARVLVANHHLLFIDLALRVQGIGFDSRAILPPFQRLVIDEAHAVENSATSLFSQSFSYYAVRKHARRLHHKRRNRTGGLLETVRRRGADPKSVTAAQGAATEAEEAAISLSEVTVSLVTELNLRLTPRTPPEIRDPITSGVGELHARLVRLANTVTDVLDDDDGEEGGPFYDLRIVLRRLERLASTCDAFQNFEEDPDHVFWIEILRAADGASYARFVSSPLDIRELMQTAVYEAFDTVVFTSATLTVGDTFQYWSGRIGLTECGREVLYVEYPSPFPFHEHVLLAVPTDAPEPTAAIYQEYLSGFLGELLELTEGHGLILFTSYAMLRQTYATTRDRLSDFGITVLRQGDEDRARLLRRFNEDSKSVLFATESFWQGVDAPGETLQVVVLCRLPFRAPTDPVLEARMEAIDERGGNPFTELSLPEAVMKFRQGFGRLVRRATDRGIVVVTDVRVLTKSYGTLFLRSLPETQVVQASRSTLLESMERFLYP